MAHCLIRAAYLLAGATASSLFVTWVPRRSDTPSKVADDLTHMDFKPDLGHTVIAYMPSHYDNLL